MWVGVRTSARARASGGDGEVDERGRQGGKQIGRQMDTEMALCACTHALERGYR